MLEHLHIRNLVIIDEAAIDFLPGMTALTGETGAGKSMLLDALGLLLGDRASADLVQAGAERAEVTAGFSLDDRPLVRDWLIAQELDSDDECLIRRTVSSAGKSRATINGSQVTLDTLSTLGRQLVAIHGQQAHQQLLKPALQRAMVDGHCDPELIQTVRQAFGNWQTLDRQIRDHQSDSATIAQRIDMLKYQLQEFDDIDIGTLTVDELETEHRWLANAERLSSLGQQSLSALDDQAAPALKTALAPLAELVANDERLREGLDLIESAAIQVEETVRLLNSAIGSLEQDDARLHWLDDKMAQLHRLGRKHLCDIGQLSEIEERLRSELSTLDLPEEKLAELEALRDQAQRDYDEKASRLSAARKSAARALSKEITAAMQALNMVGGRFEIAISSASTEPAEHGSDRVEFLVSTNAGQQPAPLARIASGGELSRISLCMQLSLLDQRSVPTMIFDEVDSGVGGAVAETVGRLLRQVGEQAQVLCVTHLPQVAAQARHHLKVGKSTAKGRTRTTIEPLSGDAVRDEIARMLTGRKISDSSRRHAEELLADAAD